MELSTADLMDLYPKALLLRPIFRDFGGKRRFFGRVRTLRVFEDNALVRKVLEEGQGQVLVVDGGALCAPPFLGATWPGWPWSGAGVGWWSTGRCGTPRS
jgi:regulator of ribonuclease activity A